MYWGKFIVCLLFGWLGVHKFMEKKIGMGFLYLFTVGLFGIGWLVDVIRYFCTAVKYGKAFGKIAAGIVGALVILGLAVGGSDEAPDTQTDSYVTTTLTVTVTVEATATAEPTIIPEEPTTVMPTAVPTATAMPTTAAEPTTAPTEEIAAKPTAKPTKEPEAEHYVLNTNTEKFHWPYCSSAGKIKASNRSEFYGTREEVISRGYEPCKICNP